jgi:hypothetical protein
MDPEKMHGKSTHDPLPQCDAQALNKYYSDIATADKPSLQKQQCSDKEDRGQRMGGKME